MPIKYILDNENNFVLYEVSGVVTHDDISTMSQEMMEQIEVDRSYNEFYLFTETTAYWAANEEYYEKIRDDMVKRDQHYGYRREKSALVTLDAYGKMVVPMWKTIAGQDENYQGETEVFHDVSIAAEWLDAELGDVKDKMRKIKRKKSF